MIFCSIASRYSQDNTRNIGYMAAFIGWRLSVMAYAPLFRQADRYGKKFISAS